LSAKELNIAIEEEPMRTDPHPKSFGDLLLFLAIGLFLLILFGMSKQFPFETSNPISWLVLAGRIIIGLAFVLFIPGYLLQCIFFPKKADLDSIERIGFSLGLSVALITLLALLLNALPWGLSPSAIVIGQGSVVFLLIVITVIVRTFQSTEIIYIPELKPHIAQWWTGLGISEQRMMLIMAGALVIALVSAAWIFLVPSENQYMTEFYMLGPEGLAENYPREATIGQVQKVTIGVTNHENSMMEYSFDVWQVDPSDQNHRQLVGYVPAFLTNIGETIQWDQSWQAAWAGQDQKFEFNLYINRILDPYRQLVLWMNINQ
jgi:uncharacterized membrane protein